MSNENDDASDSPLQGAVPASQPLGEREPLALQDMLGTPLRRLAETSQVTPLLESQMWDLAVEYRLRLKDRAAQSHRAQVEKPCYGDQLEPQQGRTLGQHEILNASTVNQAYPKFRLIKRICKALFFIATAWLIFWGRPHLIAVGIYEALYQTIKFGPFSVCEKYNECSPK